jgi:hypothetical protein
MDLPGDGVKARQDQGQDQQNHGDGADENANRQ